MIVCAGKFPKEGCHARKLKKSFQKFLKALLYHLIL